ncbi:TPA: hypothetical protein ACOJRH_003787 [Vibrio harveyi]|uniref:hypothetical protein n=1 Tax=Vibrio harveyi TaxID=669 RepID=UPI00028C4C9A|nr:hypothetical protein [Vibrio harveyi]EKM14485.1 hypothetical protein VCHENC01_0962 [Vibrio harveyi]EKO3867508.1 hypothetical protein [Vibrio harveyi]MCQ9073905.1 hypothetical protein [Vibrio harveyi]HDM8053970.1 hypothetical protein [Vibrio harveyi]HDM8192849.1 hypothetical protein [Vibrio harveyi]
MKNGFFATKLQEFLRETGVSRDFIIDAFNNSAFDELSKCDLTTLSRWVSGKTEPSLYKQYLICIVLGIDLFDYIRNVESSNYVESKKDKEIIEGYNRYLNGSNAIIGYFPRSEYVDIYYSVLDIEEQRKLLDPYLNNFSGYISLRNEVDKASIVKPFNVFLFKEKGHLCGHLSFTDDNAEYLKLFGVYSESLANSIGILPAFYIDAKVYWLLVSSLFYFYLSDGNYKQNIYATASIRDRNSWEYYKQLAGGETLTFFSPTSQSTTLDRGLFYIKFNLLKLLSKPTVLKKFQSFLKKYPDGAYLPIDM